MSRRKKFINDIEEYRYKDFVIRIKQWSDLPLVFFYDMFYVVGPNHYIKEGKWVKIRRSLPKFTSIVNTKFNAEEYTKSSEQLIKRKIHGAK